MPPPCHDGGVQHSRLLLALPQTRLRAVRRRSGLHPGVAERHADLGLVAARPVAQELDKLAKAGRYLSGNNLGTTLRLDNPERKIQTGVKGFLARMLF